MSSYVLPAFKLTDGRRIERESEWESHVEETTAGSKQVDTWWTTDRMTFRLPIVVRDAVTVSASGMPWDGFSETGVIDWFWTYHRGMADTFLYTDAKYGSTRVRFATNQAPTKANIAPGTYSMMVELEEDI
jgi:hypothetical protein